MLGALPSSNRRTGGRLTRPVLPGTLCCVERDGRADRPRRRVAYAVAGAVATGALVALAAPGVLPWRAGALFGWVAFVPLLVVIQQVPVRAAAWLGWLAGAVFTVGTCAWFPGPGRRMMMP